MGAPEIRRLVASASGPSYRPPVRDPRQADAVQLEDPTTLPSDAEPNQRPDDWLKKRLDYQDFQNSQLSKFKHEPSDADTYQPPRGLGESMHTPSRPVPPQPTKEVDPFADLDAADAADLSERDRPPSRTFLDDTNDRRDAAWKWQTENQKRWNDNVASIEATRPERDWEDSLPKIPAVAPEDRSAPSKPSLGSPSGTPQPRAARPAAPSQKELRQSQLPKSTPARPAHVVANEVRAGKTAAKAATQEQVDELREKNRARDKSTPAAVQKPTNGPTPRELREQMQVQEDHSRALDEFERQRLEDEASDQDAIRAGLDPAPRPPRLKPVLPFSAGGPRHREENEISASDSAAQLTGEHNPEQTPSQRLLELINPGGVKATGKSDEEAWSDNFGHLHPDDRVKAMHDLIKANEPTYSGKDGQLPSKPQHPSVSHRPPTAGSTMPLVPLKEGDTRQTTTFQAPGGRSPQQGYMPSTETLKNIGAWVNSGDADQERKGYLHMAKVAGVDLGQYRNEDDAVRAGKELWDSLKNSQQRGYEPGTTWDGTPAMVPGEGAKAATEARQLEMDQKALVKTYPTDSDGNPTSDMIYGAKNKAELREIQTGLRRGRASNQAQAGQQHNRNMGDAQNMGFVSYNAPAKQAVGLRNSLQDAAGDPEKQAEILRYYGQNDQADAVLMRHNEEQAIQGGHAEAAAARADADPVQRHGRIMGQINGNIANGQTGPALAMWNEHIHPAETDGTKDPAKAEVSFTQHVAAMDPKGKYIENKLDSIHSVVLDRTWSWQQRRHWFLTECVKAGIPHPIAAAYEARPDKRFK